MPLPMTRVAAEHHLADDLLFIGDCLHAGVERLNEVRSTLGPISLRTQASLVHDFAAEHAEAIFAERPDVTTRRCQDLMVIDFDGRILVRFRKLSDGWSFSRNDTDQTRLWEAQMPLEGFPTATNLTAGYRLDDTGRVLESAALVCTLLRRYQWHIDLPAMGQVFVMPRTLEDGPVEELEDPAIGSELDEEAAEDDDLAGS